MANEIITEVILDLDKSRKQLQRLEKNAKKSGQKAGRKLGKGLEDRAARSFQFLNKRILALGAALVTAFAGREIIRAANRQEDAVNTLAESLRRTGELTKETQQDILDFASALQKTTTIGDETVLELFALTQAFGATAEQAKVATQAAIELGAAARISLEEAARRVGRAFSGSVEDIAKFAPAIRNLTKEQLRAGEASQLLVDALGGAAAAKIRIFAGATIQLGNSFGDLLENIGFFLTKSPSVIAFVNELSRLIGDLATSIGGFNGDAMKPLLNGFLSLGRIGTNIVVPFFDVFRGVVDTVSLIVGQLVLDLQRLKGLFSDNATNILVAAEAVKALENSFAGFELTEGANKIITELQEVVNKAGPTATSVGNAISKKVADPIKGITFEDFEKAFNDTATNIKVSANQLAASLKAGLVGGLSNSLASFGGALAKGEDAFEAFGKTILGALGAILIQFGTMLIAIGIGLSTVPFLFFSSGPAAVAAGAAAVVLGGALSALAGAGGGANIPAAAGTTVTPVSGAAASDIGEDLSESLEGLQEERTQVVINVQGNILDRRQTGIELAEILAEVSSSNAIVIRSGA